MTNITAALQELYLPSKLLVIYKQAFEENKSIYVESFDLNSKGMPVNAHPLNSAEAVGLAEALYADTSLGSHFLQPETLLPVNLLHIRPGAAGWAVWYTKATKVQLFFSQQLGIPAGKASIPPLLWKATKEELCIYALTSDRRPGLDTPLCHAPFFNLYKNGKVCMGTVDIEIDNDCRLENFMELWQEYFFNSYFSHLLDDYCPVSVNIVTLWKELIGTNKPFPLEVLTVTSLTLKNLLQ